MQLDAEEEGQSFYKPPAVNAAAPAADTGQKPTGSETQAGNAATVTAEQEA